jgi:hypothetical protein
MRERLEAILGEEPLRSNLHRSCPGTLVMLWSRYSDSVEADARAGVV